MNVYYSKSLRALAITLVMLNMVEQAVAQGGGKDRRGPPPEAIAACDGLAVGSSCEFTGRRDDLVSGICASPPSDDSVVACKPDGGRPPTHDTGSSVR